MRKQCAVSLIAILTALGSTSATAQAADDTKAEIKIEAQPLDRALSHLGQQFDTQIVVYADDASNLTAKSIEGEYSETEALNFLLNGSGLEYRRVNDRMIAVGTPDRLAANYAQKEEVSSFRVAQLDQEDDRAVEINSNASSDRSDEQERDVIVVTGSNIRGAQNPASPVVVFDREEIDKSGFATVQQFLQTVPQNFNGGASDNTAGGFAAPGQGRFGSTSGINLRGLGTSSTLTLLNGQRMAPAGFGQVVDVSIIPTSAIERIEILTDGASAIYGSDAIAGVTNIILRDDYDGAETQLRYGFLADSDSQEYRAAQTLGESWSGGNALVSYEYHKRTELDSEDRDFSKDAADTTFLLPDQERHSVFANLNQDVGDDFRLSARGFFSDRNLSDKKFQIGFSPDDFTGGVRNYGGSLGLEYDLSENWQIRVDGLYSQTQSDSTVVGVDSGFVQSDTKIKSDTWSITGIVDGKLLSLPGGDIRTSIGGHFRDEGFKNENFGAILTDERRDIWALFGEMIIPIVGEDNRAPGIESLQFSVAARYEEYSDFGDSFNPKFGLVWEPTVDLKLRGTYSTSFRAPTFDDLKPFDAFIFGLPDPLSMSGTTPSLIPIGGNPNLQPEESEMYTVGFDYRPDFLPGLDVSFTYYDVLFENRIDATSVLFFDSLAEEDLLGPLVVRNPALATAQSVADQASSLIPFGGLTISDVDAIVFRNLQNIGTTDVSGVDFSVDYSFPTDAGDFVTGVSASYISNFEDRFSGQSTSVPGVNVVFNPADLRLRGTLGWNHGGYSASVFVNHISGYEDNRVDPAVAVSSWTTVDLYLAYSTGETVGSNLLSGITLSLSAVNLLNEDPPFVNNAFSGVNFDGANHNALGRFLSFQVTKNW